MKLVRLATDNNGIFASAFQNDMVIDKNSQMALLNLTFQSEYSVLSINDSNNIITFKSNKDIATTQSTSTLNQLNYDINNYNNFFSDLTYNLNKAIALDDFENCMSTQWFIRNYSDRKTLEYRYAPFFNPLNMFFGGGSQQFPVMSFDQLKISAVTGVAPAERTTIQKVAGQIATTDRSTVMTTNAKMSVGNALLTIRTLSSVDNTSGLVDNGYGIGLSKLNLRNPDIYEEGDDIPASARDFEIIYNRPGENYKFIDLKSTEKDSGIPPLLVNGGDQGEHDLIYYQIANGKLEGGVLQMGVKDYINLPLGNDWIQVGGVGGGNLQKFDELNLGQIARYRRTQVSDASVEEWWEPTNATTWNIYDTGPPTIGQTATGTATIDGIGTLTIGAIQYVPFVTSPAAVVNGGSYRRPFFSVDLKPGEELYPYLYLRGAAGQVSVDAFNYSLDPWINQNYSTTVDEEGDFRQDGWGLTGTDFAGSPSSGWTNSINAIYTSGDLFYGTANNAFQLPTPASWSETTTMVLTLHSDIWRFLGHTNLNNGGYVTKEIRIGSVPVFPMITPCWSWFVGEKEVLPSNSDNYLVESMSLPLDSFDASQIQYPEVAGFLNPSTDKRGRRKNILMTIPVNDNNNNLVEYESNTPIFIDINNAEEINAKNLNFRILNKNFDSIKQSGDTAIMTILIKKENE